MLIYWCHVPGSAWIVGKFAYYTALQASPIFILEGGEERMKMELANMYVLWNKSNDMIW